MLRRVVAPLAFVGILAGCSTFPTADTVARVNDTTMSTDLLADLTTLLGDQAASPEGDGVNADATRNLIAQWIQVEVVVEHLDDIGVEITDDDRATAAASVDADPTLTDITEGARSYLSEAQAAIDVFNQLPDPQASFETALDDADIFIKARYGFFDPQFGVLPVGVGIEPGSF